MARLDVLMGVGRDVRGDTNLDREGCFAQVCLVDEQAQFVEVIDHDCTDPCCQGFVELTRGFGIAMHMNMACGDTGVQRQCKLATRNHIEGEALGVHQLRDCRIEQCFAGIVHDGIGGTTSGTGIDVGFAHGADGRFVVDVERRIVFGRQRDDVESRHKQMPVRADPGRHGPDVTQRHGDSIHVIL